MSYEVAITESHAADIVATKDPQRIIVEIETGKSDAANNLRKVLDASTSQVVSLLINEVLLKNLEAEFAAYVALGRLNLIVSSDLTNFWLKLTNP